MHTILTDGECVPYESRDDAEAFLESVLGFCIEKRTFLISQSLVRELLSVSMKRMKQLLLKVNYG